jgi:cytochrome P450
MKMFSDGDVFNVARSPTSTRLGIGEHFCLGAGFARLEIRVMFEELPAGCDIEQAAPAERLQSTFIGGSAPACPLHPERVPVTPAQIV